MKINSQMKQVFYYGTGLVAAKILSVVMLPIITRMLSPAEYGTLEILQTCIDILLTIFCIGQTEAIFRFGGMAENHQITNKICINSALLVFFISIIASSLIIVFSSQISTVLPGNTNAWQIMYLGLLMLSASVIYVQLDWLRLIENVTTFVGVNLIRSLIQAGLVLIALYTSYNVTGIMLAAVISNTLIFLYLTPIQLRDGLPYDRTIIKRLFFYGVPLIFTGLSDFVFLSLIIWWLAYAMGPADMAKFALALKFSLFTFFLLQPFSMWWFPKRYKHLSTEEDRYYCMQISELGVVLGLLCAFSITLGGSLFIHWFIPATYQEAIVYLPLSCFVLVLKPLADMTNTGLFIEKTKTYMWINTTMALLTIVGYYFFIPRYHAWGALFVLGFVLLLRWASCLILSQKELYLPYRYKKTGLFIVVAGLCQACIWHMSTTSDYILKGGVLWLLLVIMAWYLKLLPRLQQLVELKKK